MPRSMLVLVLVLLVGVLAGCPDPYQQDRARDRTSPTEAQTAMPQTRGGDNVRGGDDVSARAPARDTAPTNADNAPSIANNARARARSAVNVFCSEWTNWSWRTIGRQQRRLAALATGPLARQLAAEAQVRVQDQALRRDRLGARGHVVAIDVKRGSATRRAVCVVWEQPLTDGRANQTDARHHVYLVTVTHTRDGWAVSQWQPQP